MRKQQVHLEEEEAVAEAGAGSEGIAGFGGSPIGCVTSTQESLSIPGPIVYFSPKDEEVATFAPVHELAS